jgi:hypothetical protein
MNPTRHNAPHQNWSPRARFLSEGCTTCLSLMRYFLASKSVILSLPAKAGDATQHLHHGCFCARCPCSFVFDENDALPTSNVFSRYARSAPEAQHNLAQRGSAGYAIDEKQSAVGAAQSFDSNVLDRKKKSVILSPPWRRKDPSWSLLSMVVIFCHSLNATWRNLSLQGSWRPGQFAGRFSATNKTSAICSMSEKRFVSNEKTSVILSEPKDLSFFSLS